MTGHCQAYEKAGVMQTLGCTSIGWQNAQQGKGEYSQTGRHTLGSDTSAVTGCNLLGTRLITSYICPQPQLTCHRLFEKAGTGYVRHKGWIYSPGSHAAFYACTMLPNNMYSCLERDLMMDAWQWQFQWQWLKDRTRDLFQQLRLPNSTDNCFHFNLLSVTCVTQEK